MAHPRGARIAKRTANAIGARSDPSTYVAISIGERRPKGTVLRVGVGAVRALTMMIGVDAFVGERGHEQRYADERVPHERERRHVALRAMRDLVNEEHRAIKPEDRDGQQKRPQPAAGDSAEDERAPADRRAAQQIGPVRRGRRLEPLDWNRAESLRRWRAWAEPRRDETSGVVTVTGAPAGRSRYRA